MATPGVSADSGRPNAACSSEAAAAAEQPAAAALHTTKRGLHAGMLHHSATRTDTHTLSSEAVQDAVGSKRIAVQQQLMLEDSSPGYITSPASPTPVQITKDSLPSKWQKVSADGSFGAAVHHAACASATAETAAEDVKPNLAELLQEASGAKCIGGGGADPAKGPAAKQQQRSSESGHAGQQGVSAACNAQQQQQQTAVCLQNEQSRLVQFLHDAVLQGLSPSSSNKSAVQSLLASLGSEHTLTQQAASAPGQQWLDRTKGTAATIMGAAGIAAGEWASSGGGNSSDAAAAGQQALFQAAASAVASALNSPKADHTAAGSPGSGHAIKQQLAAGAVHSGAPVTSGKFAAWSTGGGKSRHGLARAADNKQQQGEQQHQRSKPSSQQQRRWQHEQGSQPTTGKHIDFDQHVQAVQAWQQALERLGMQQQQQQGANKLQQQEACSLEQPQHFLWQQLWQQQQLLSQPSGPSLNQQQLKQQQGLTRSPKQQHPGQQPVTTDEASYQQAWMNQLLQLVDLLMRHQAIGRVLQQLLATEQQQPPHQQTLRHNSSNTSLPPYGSGTLPDDTAAASASLRNAVALATSSGGSKVGFPISSAADGPVCRTASLLPATDPAMQAALMPPATLTAPPPPASAGGAAATSNDSAVGAELLPLPAVAKVVGWLPGTIAVPAASPALTAGPAAAATTPGFSTPSIGVLECPGVQLQPVNSSPPIGKADTAAAGMFKVPKPRGGRTGQQQQQQHPGWDPSSQPMGAPTVGTPRVSVLPCPQLPHQFVPGPPISLTPVLLPQPSPAAAAAAGPAAVAVPGEAAAAATAAGPAAADSQTATVNTGPVPAAIGLVASAQWLLQLAQAALSYLKDWPAGLLPNLLLKLLLKAVKAVDRAAAQQAVQALQAGHLVTADSSSGILKMSPAGQEAMQTQNVWACANEVVELLGQQGQAGLRRDHLEALCESGENEQVFEKSVHLCEALGVVGTGGSGGLVLQMPAAA